MEIREFPYARLGALTVAVCLFGACAAPARTAVVTTPPDTPVREADRDSSVTEKDEAIPDGVFHRVLPGQTLWRIARTYDVPLARVVEYNGIEDAAHIDVGAMVWIPGASRSLDVEVYKPPTIDGSEWLWPVPGGKVISGYGAPRRTHRHGGVDIGAAHGQPVRASRAGTVVYSGGGLRGYGKTVILDHGDGVRSLYAHNSDLLVRMGDRVERGASIARIGRTGNATADHCHFEIRVHDRRIDPMPWIAADRRAAR